MGAPNAPETLCTFGAPGHVASGRSTRSLKPNSRMAADHNRDIATAAKAILRPIGCVQKGRSRTWLDDRGWWVAVVEFQPSGWSKGSYLNVAACFLWAEKDSLSFDDPAGERPWFDAAEGQSFLDKANILASQARDAILRLRERHTSTASSASWLTSRPRLSNHGHFHAAVALGLSGNSTAAGTHFKAATDLGTDIPWVLELNDTCARLGEIVSNRRAFVEAVSDTIQRTRRLMRLPEIEDLGSYGL
jgi:hypothetical protein